MEPPLGLSLSEDLVVALVLSLSRALDLVLLLSAAGAEAGADEDEDEETDLVVILLPGAAAGAPAFFSWVALVMRSLLLFITCCSF